MTNKKPLAAIAVAAAVAAGAGALTQDSWKPQLQALLGGQGETAAPAELAKTEPAKAAETVKPPATEATAAAPVPKTVPAPETKPAPESKPAFDTVRVEKTGEAVIAGTAAPGADVAVKLDGETVGTAKANDEGAFVVVPEKALPAGTGALTLEQTAPSGEIAASDQTVAVAVPEPAKPEETPKETMVALVAPDEPAKVIQTPVPAKPDELTLDSINYDDKGDIVFKGKSPANAAVRLYVDNAPLSDVMSDATGLWAYTGKGTVPPGTHTLRVDQLTGAGAVAQRLELPFTREAPEKLVAAVAPAPVQSETAAALAPAAAAKPKDGRIVIQPGNNLWKLSQVIYGEGTRYTVIYQANKSNIRDADLIYPGQIFMVPDATPPERIAPDRKEPLSPAEGGASAQ